MIATIGFSNAAPAPLVEPETVPETKPDEADAPGEPTRDDPFVFPRPDQEPPPLPAADPARRHQTCERVELRDLILPKAV
jgi:hypothetical protein